LDVHVGIISSLDFADGTEPSLSRLLGDAAVDRTSPTPHDHVGVVGPTVGRRMAVKIICVRRGLDVVSVPLLRAL